MTVYFAGSSTLYSAGATPVGDAYGEGNLVFPISTPKSQSRRLYDVKVV